MWDAMSALAGQVLNMRASKNDGDRLLAYKCMETMILLYSYRSRGAQPTRKVDPSLDLVPVQHPFLDVRAAGRAGSRGGIGLNLCPSP